MKGIYKITNKSNGKVYIGQSENLINRKRNHFYWLGRNEHHNQPLQKAYNKHGEESFVFEILEETDDLDNREIYFINEYGGINSYLNYNLKNPLTNEFSDYVKVKQSKTMTGKNNPNFGNKWTDEMKQKLSNSKKGVTLEERLGKEKADLVKEKMRQSQTGRVHPEEVKEKIRQHNIGEKNPAYGMGDRQRGEKNPMWGKESENRKPILQYTKDGILVKEYDFISQVHEDGFSIGNVSNCARKIKGYKSHKGFIWKYKEENQ